MIKLQRHFDIADGRRGYWAEQHKLHLRQREEAAKRDRLDDESEADFASFATGAIAATEVQLKEFRKSLQSYETATVEALLTNDEALDLIQQKMDLYLAHAHVLDDGRRVFKTRDGSQVFDEFGEEVGVDLIAPDDIDDAHPVWEDYQPLLETKTELTEQREKLLEFQDELDLVRDELDSGAITSDRLSQLDSRLADLAASSIQPHRSGIEVHSAEFKASPEGFAQPGVAAPAKLGL